MDKNLLPLSRDMVFLGAKADKWMFSWIPNLSKTQARILLRSFRKCGRFRYNGKLYRSRKSVRKLILEHVDDNLAAIEMLGKFKLL